MVRKRKIKLKKGSGGNDSVNNNSVENTLVLSNDVAKLISDATKADPSLANHVKIDTSQQSVIKSDVNRKRNNHNTENTDNKKKKKRKKKKINTLQNSVDDEQKGKKRTHKHQEEGKDEEQVTSIDSEKKRRKVADTHVVASTNSDRLDSAWYQSPHASIDTVVKEQAPNELKGRLPIIREWHEKARQLLDELVKDHKREKSKRVSADERLMHTFLTSGTIADKVAAMTLLVHESPILQLEQLDDLLKMAQKRGTRESSMAIDSLHQLFLNELLPNRKLAYFHERTLPSVAPVNLEDNDSNNNDDDHEVVIPKNLQLVYWYFEGELKKKYAMFIDCVESATQDTLAFAKKSGVFMLYELLMSKPEKEHRILSAFVNKLGDPDRKIPSKVIHLTGMLLQQHPGMRAEVVREVEQLVFRPNIRDRAKYYGVTVMNEIILSADQPELANNLIQTYLTIFTDVISRHRERITSLQKPPVKVKHQKRKGIVVDKKQQKKNKKKNKRHQDQRQKLSVSVVSESESKLLAALLTGMHRAIPYASLDTEMIEQHLDALFRVVHSAQFTASVQALTVLSQLNSLTNGSVSVSNRFYRAIYEKLLSPQLQVSKKKEMFMNLLYRCLKADKCMERVAAFCKRMVGVALVSHRAEFTCGILYLLSEILQIHSVVRECMLDNKPWVEQASTEFEVVSEVNDEQVVVKGGEQPTEYNCRKRDPQYSGAHLSSLYELNLLCYHYHPTVIRWATCIINGEKIVYTGDPLRDFTASAFFDRFVYRNPKKATDSATRARKGHFAMLSSRKNGRASQPPVNSVEFLRLKTVPADEQFFHTYFLEREKHRPSKGDASEVHLVNDADEAEMDAFADELMENEMKKYGNADIDDDNDDPAFYDYSSDDDDDGDDDDGDAAADDDDVSGMFPAFVDDDDDNNDEEDVVAFAADNDKDGDGNGEESNDGKSSSVYASADDFADILEQANEPIVHPKQQQWEERTHSDRRHRKKRRKRR